MPDDFPARLRRAVRAEAESYHRRNATPVWARLSIGPNQALVSRILKAGDGDPVWGEFEARMRERYRELERLNDHQLLAAVLEAWQSVENGDER